MAAKQKTQPNAAASSGKGGKGGKGDKGDKGEKQGAAHGGEGIQPIARNKKAFHNYEVLERLECGMVLHGSEVKSLREGSVSFIDSYAEVRDGELFLVGLHIGEYRMATAYQHKILRRRKLLAHKRQIRKLQHAAEAKGLTLVPLSLYWRRGKGKIEIGLVRGKAVHDKRDSLKKRELDREKERALRAHR